MPVGTSALREGVSRRVAKAIEPHVTYGPPPLPCEQIDAAADAAVGALQEELAIAFLMADPDRVIDVMAHGISGHNGLPGAVDMDRAARAFEAFRCLASAHLNDSHGFECPTCGDRSGIDLDAIGHMLASVGLNDSRRVVERVRELVERAKGKEYLRSIFVVVDIDDKPREVAIHAGRALELQRAGAGKSVLTMEVDRHLGPGEALPSTSCPEKPVGAPLLGWLSDELWAIARTDPEGGEKFTALLAKHWPLAEEEGKCR